MNFFVLDEADMVMRHVIIYGVSGFDKLGQTLNDIWMPDIKRNQLPGVLAGLAPIRSLVNVGSGFKDLVVVPMREYKKDVRIVGIIQKGAFSFANTTSNELVKLGAKLAIGTQTVLQSAEDFLGAPKTAQTVHHHFDGEGDSSDEEEKKQISHYADQPVGVVQGLRGAFSSLERDLLTARDAIVAVPGEVMESGSAAGAAKAVWRRAPTVILRPAIGATRAVGQTLLGAGNTLDPANRRRIEDVSFLMLYFYVVVVVLIVDSRNIKSISFFLQHLHIGILKVFSVWRYTKPFDRFTKLQDIPICFARI
jgi:autophagy-related protein 2